MTRDEYESQRRELLENLVIDPAIEYSIDIVLVKLDKLQAEYAAARKTPEQAFYDHINGLNADTRVYMATQGNGLAEIAIIEGMMARLTARKAALEGES